MNMKRLRGFTLIELMITIVVAVVLLGIAVPSFRTLMANNRATTQANALFTALNYARSEAIGRRDTVTVCPKATASMTSTTCGGTGDWANGWFVFTDLAGGTIGSFNSGAGDTVLKHWAPLPGDATLSTTASLSYIGFNRDGEKRTVSADEVRVRMSEADTSGDADRCVRVVPIGMVRVHKVTATATCPIP